jgi:5-methyltetrahydrofolate--homocysteine methyltransferase
VALNLHFREEEWERVERDWKAWWAGELDRPMVLIQGRGELDDAQSGSITWSNTFGCAFQFPPEMPFDQVLDFYEGHLRVQRYFGDAWPRWWPNFGPGIVAGFLGARVDYAPETNTVWFHPADPVSIEDLELVYDANNRYWQWALGLTRATVERIGRQVTIGLTDLGGNLDILASMLTADQLLFAFMDAPEEVDRLVGDLTRLWLRYYNELYDAIIRAGRGVTDWSPLWAPGKCYMMQSDFAYMISPQMFERFVIPDLAACCEVLDYGFYHLDGIGQIGHLDLLLSLERLRGIQWIPGDGQAPPEAWLTLLKRIRDGGKLCQLYVSPEGALRIVRELGGRGFALQIRNPMTQDEADQYLALLAAENAIH